MSSKTQKANVENVTESAPKRTTRKLKVLLILVVVTVLIVMAGALVRLWNSDKPPVTSAQCDLQVGDSCFTLEVAATDAARTLGLSGRRTLPKDQAMLFDFGQPVETCFWMKDMNFPIDIVWLNSRKEVVTIASNVQPSSYPESFCPESSSEFVIEFNAGVAERLGLSQGQKLDFTAD